MSKDYANAGEGGGGCSSMDGKERRERTRDNSWERRMVTMATAAESRMMRGSERENSR